jgi:sulfate transport system substrate-binding protein
VRKGNPKAIRDWPDLIRPGVQVVTPDPKTSGEARWNFLAAWAWAQKQGGEKEAETYVRELFAHVPILDTGARGATMSFAEHQIGDALIAWENEALLARKQLAGQVEIVRPSYSILAEPPVAVVDKIADAHRTRATAQAYLEALWRDWAQDLGARNYFRPRVAAVAARWSAQFPDLPMATIADLGGWQAAQQKFFANGGVFDQIYPAKH